MAPWTPRTAWRTGCSMRTCCAAHKPARATTAKNLYRIDVSISPSRAAHLTRGSGVELIIIVSTVDSNSQPDSQQLGTPRTAPADEPMLYCPVCSQRLASHRCKLICEQ